MNNNLINFIINNYNDYNTQKILFISTNFLSINRNEIEKIKNINNIKIVYTYILGLLGVRGLIKNLRLQELLIKIYGEKYLFFISNIILNFLIDCKIQWIATNNHHYFYQIQQKTINYYSCRENLMDQKNQYTFLKKPTKFSLKVGMRINEGVIGSYRMVNETPLKKKNYYQKINQKIINNNGILH